MLDILVREQDQSRGPLGRFGGLLPLTRWLSASCSVLTGHFFFFVALSHVLGSPPTGSCHPVANVLVLSVPSSTAVPALPSSLPCDVFFFFFFL